MSKRKTTREFPTSEAIWSELGHFPVFGKVNVHADRVDLFYNPRGRVPDIRVTEGRFSVPFETRTIWRGQHGGEKG